jgi:hypothetical protein
MKHIHAKRPLVTALIWPDGSTPILATYVFISAAFSKKLVPFGTLRWSWIQQCWCRPCFQTAHRQQYFGQGACVHLYTRHFA